MNFVQGKSNQYLREAIFEGNVEKARQNLTRSIGKADVKALTESGGFSMLHCAALAGNTQITMMLLQFGADVNALTDDGYSALDLAIWKGHLQVMELLRSQGCVAPMKEPESLNGKIILHHGRQATVVDFEPSTSIRTSSLRALHYSDGECRLVNLWAGTDYKIVGNNPNYEELKRLNYTYQEIQPMAPNPGATTTATSDTQSQIHYQTQQSSISAFRGRSPSTTQQPPMPGPTGAGLPPQASMRIPNGAGPAAAGSTPQSLDDILQGQAFIDNDEDSDEESEIDDIIEITVPPGPLAVLLNSGIQECAVVHGFTTLPNGMRGPVESTGKVLPGMYIIGINEFNASIMSLAEVTQLLGRLARKEKTIRFAVFRPGAHQRPDSETSKSDRSSAQDNASTAGSDAQSQPLPARSPVNPPAPAPFAPLAPRKSSGSISSSAMPTSFAAVASALMSRTSSSPMNLNVNPSECVHCHMPISHHTSDACPYK